MSRNVVKPIVMTDIESTGVSAAYAAINASGLPFPCFYLLINNDSTEDVTVSMDGVNPHFYVPTMTQLAINAQTNNQPSNHVAQWAAGTVVWVKGTTGTGFIYLSGLYQPS